MALNDLKTLNLIQLAGRINVKRYNEQSKSLFLVLSVSVPKSALASKSPEDTWNRDYPSLVITGEDAVKVNALYNEGDRIAVIGHMETRQRMSYEGNRMYKEVWEPYIAVDSLLPASGRIDANLAILSGEIIRVYRNGDAGKHFYMITMKMVDNDGKESRATFTYFDPRMELEPQVGEKVFASGVIQTKREVTTGSDGNDRTRFIMSVVCRNIIIEREKSEKKDEPPVERAGTDSPVNETNNDLPSDEAEDELLSNEVTSELSENEDELDIDI